MQDNNVYKQFVSNRVQKIKQQSFLQWNYVLITSKTHEQMDQPGYQTEKIGQNK